MSSMMSFVTWFVQQIPAFLLAEPISAFTGLAILAFVVGLTRRMMSVSR